YGPALEALEQADVVVIGPGSLFTSIIPNFLVGGVADALGRSIATVIYVCNVANLRGETSGMDAADHVDALARHGLDHHIDVVLVHVPERGEAEVASAPPVLERIAARGIRVIAADLVGESPTRHDETRLARALSEVW
ncbi:YvcK family protein, partial [bacterium]|nr:YvcK family protein [bacterium]